MGKKIKKINEFQDDWEFDIDQTELTEEQKKEEIEYINKMTEENLKNFPKAKSPQFTIEEFREIMLDLQRIDNFEYSQEEKEELDRDCMEMYGEPFFKKDNDKFKVGDRVNAFEESYNDKEGIITNIYTSSVDKIVVYRVEFNAPSSHIQYFKENELDLSIQEKRDRSLKELGI